MRLPQRGRILAARSRPSRPRPPHRPAPQRHRPRIGPAADRQEPRQLDQRVARDPPGAAREPDRALDLGGHLPPARARSTPPLRTISSARSSSSPSGGPWPRIRRSSSRSAPSLQRVQHRQRCRRPPGCRCPGSLPSSSCDGGDVHDVVGQLEGHPERARRSRRAARRARRGASDSSPPSRHDVAISDAGLAPDDLQVVLLGLVDRRGAVATSRICPSHSVAIVCASRRQTSVPRSAEISEARANRKSPDRMATCCPTGRSPRRRRGGTPPRRSRRRGTAWPRA